MIKINYKTMKRLYSAMIKIIPGKSSIPILQGVLFSEFEDGFTVRATNLDESLSYTEGDCDGEALHSFVIKRQDFKSLVDSMESSMSLEINAEKDKVKINYVVDGGMSISSTMSVESAEVFPEQIVNRLNFQPINISTFLDVYRKALPAVSQDETRQALCNVFFDAKNKCTVSTNGRILKVQDYLDNPFSSDVLVPVTKTLSQAKYFNPETIRVSHEDNVLILDDGDWQYSTKTADQAFPNYHQVVPDIQTYTAKYSVPKYVLEKVPSMRKQLSAGVKDNTVSLVLLTGQLYLMVYGPTTWQSVPINGTYTSSSTLPVVVHCNGDFLCTAIKGLDECTMYLKDSTSPIVFKDGSTTSIIMPVRGTSDPEEVIKHIKPFTSQAEKTEIAESPKEALPPKAESPTQATQQLKVVAKADILSEVFEMISELEEQHRETRAKMAVADKAVRDCQLGLRTIRQKVKSYEKDINRRLKDVKQAEDLVSRLSKLVA